MEILNNTKAKRRSQGIAFGIFRLKQTDKSQNKRGNGNQALFILLQPSHNTNIPPR